MPSSTLTFTWPFGASAGRKSSVSTFRASVTSSSSFFSSRRWVAFCFKPYASEATARPARSALLPPWRKKARNRSRAMFLRRAPCCGSKNQVAAATAAPKPRSRFMNPLSLASPAPTQAGGDLCARIGVHRDARLGRGLADDDEAVRMPLHGRLDLTDLVAGDDDEVRGLRANLLVLSDGEEDGLGARLSPAFAQESDVLAGLL